MNRFSFHYCILPILVLFFLIQTILPARSSEPLAAEVESETIDRLVKQMGSPMFAEREAASERLLAIGEPAFDALEQATTEQRRQFRL